MSPAGLQDGQQKMRVAYFVNQYPAISHSFVRREIQALERQGLDVARYAIRPIQRRYHFG